MLSVIKRNPVSVVLAILLHILIVVFLIYGFDWSKLRKPASPKANVVQAHTVDAKQLDQAKEKEKAAERKKQKQREEALQRKQAEEKKRQQQLEQKRIAKEKAEQKQREVERKRQAQLKKEQEAKKKAEAKRLAEQEAKREAEAKRKAEAEAKRKAELERKRKAELEAKRKAEARRKAEAAAQAERERALQEQLAAEQNSREIDRYVAVIKQQIERNWLKPGQAAGKELSCVVQVRLIPGGDVVPGGVSIIRSSGNPAFDRSVETAVYKAAPLQVPSGPLFESFRTLRLNFKPSG